MLILICLVYKHQTSSNAIRLIGSKTLLKWVLFSSLKCVSEQRQYIKAGSCLQNNGLIVFSHRNKKRCLQSASGHVTNVTQNEWTTLVGLDQLHFTGVWGLSAWSTVILLMPKRLTPVLLINLLRYVIQIHHSSSLTRSNIQPRPSSDLKWSVI